MPALGVTINDCLAAVPLPGATHLKDSSGVEEIEKRIILQEQKMGYDAVYRVISPRSGFRKSD